MNRYFENNLTNELLICRKKKLNVINDIVIKMVDILWDIDRVGKYYGFILFIMW